MNNELKEIAKKSWKENKDDEYDFELDGDYYIDGFLAGHNHANKKINELEKELSNRVRICGGRDK
jgi:hypothetical protein